jgi:hypothetical protein
VVENVNLKDSILLLDDFKKSVLSRFSENFFDEITLRISFLETKYPNYLVNLLDYFQDTDSAAMEFIADEVRLKLKNKLDSYTIQQLLNDFDNKTAEFEILLWGVPYVITVENWQQDLSLDFDALRGSLYDFIEYSEVSQGILFNFVD